MDENRRKFLTIMLIGSGAFLVDRIFNPLFSRFWSGSFTKTNPKINPPDKKDLKMFHIVEKKNQLLIYDSSGEKIFQIDDGE